MDTTGCIIKFIALLCAIGGVVCLFCRAWIGAIFFFVIMLVAFYIAAEHDDVHYSNH